MSIHKSPGHKRPDSTVIYARVHDRTVAEDYYAAMEGVEQRLEVIHPRWKSLLSLSRQGQFSLAPSCPYSTKSLVFSVTYLGQ